MDHEARSSIDFGSFDEEGGLGLADDDVGADVFVFRLDHSHHDVPLAGVTRDLLADGEREASGNERPDVAACVLVDEAVAVHALAETLHLPVAIRPFERRSGSARSAKDVLRLPEPMLARSGEIPRGAGWVFEPKFDGVARTLGCDRVWSRWVCRLRSTGMSGGRATLVVSVVVMLVLSGCGSSSKKSVAGLPLWQRVILGGELVGYDPPLQPPPTLNLAQFVVQAQPSYIEITKASATKELMADGFRMATIETFPGSSPKAPLVASSVLWVGSPQQAQKVVHWTVTDTMLPCPETCNAQWNAVKVSGIPGAMGAYRHNIVSARRRFESYNIAYADGPFVYDLFALDQNPGTLKQKDLLNAVKAQYKRVKGAPLPRYLVRRPAPPNGAPPTTSTP